MKTTGCLLLAFLFGACSGPAPTDNAAERGAPVADALDANDGGPPAVDCSASTADVGTELYQGRGVRSVMLTRRGCSITIDYAIK